MDKDSETKKPEKYKRLIADTLIFALGNLGSKIILFFMVPLYTNTLSKAEYGISDLVFTAGQLLVPFVSLVIFDAVGRFGLARDADKRGVLKSGLTVVLLGSLVSVAVTPAFRLYAPLAEWRWYLCAYVILSMLGSVEMNYLKIIDRNKAYAAISILHTLVLALANVMLLAVRHWGIRGYVTAAVLGSATTAVLACIAGRVPAALREGKTDRRLLRDMVRYSAPLILNNISWWVIQSSDKFMIETMTGAAALGLYTAATKIPSLINVIISIFSQAWGISSVREYEHTNDKSFYSEVFVSYSVIGFGAAVCINTIVKPFMSIYVAREFREAWRFVPLLLASASFSAVASYFGSLYGALKKSTNNMFSTLSAAIINIIVNYVFILRMGAWGAIIGTVTAYVFLAMFRMIDVLRFIRFDPQWKQYLMNVTIVLVQAVLVSLDYHIWAVAAVSLALFAAVNRRTIVQLTVLGIGLIRRH